MGSPLESKLIVVTGKGGVGKTTIASPRTFGAIARVGPIAGQAEHVRALLRDPAASSYVAVAQPTEMAVSEAIELQDGLARELGRSLSGVVVNGLLPQRFSAEEL